MCRGAMKAGEFKLSKFFGDIVDHKKRRNKTNFQCHMKMKIVAHSWAKPLSYTSARRSPARSFVRFEQQSVLWIHSIGFRWALCSMLRCLVKQCDVGSCGSFIVSRHPFHTHRRLFRSQSAINFILIGAWAVFIVDETKQHKFFFFFVRSLFTFFFFWSSRWAYWHDVCVLAVCDGSWW